MSKRTIRLVLRRLGSAAAGPGVAALTDRQLLERCVAVRDDDAFEELMRRHGPMVFAVCRRLLPSRQDAEDAFQATFLVLARKAAAVRPPEKVGSWLYGVAYRAAMRVRTAAARRGAREKTVSKLPEPATVDAGLWQDLLPVLDQELSRLPDKYRLPLVLCELEGKTRKQAAQQLGWPEGTVAGRLAQARAMLARKLRKLGLPVSGGVLAAAIAQNAAPAGVPAALTSAALGAAGLMVTGQAAMAGVVSARVAALADGVLKTMLIAKLKGSGLVLFVAGVVALALAFGSAWTMDGAGEPAPARAAERPRGSEASRPNTPAEGVEKELGKLCGAWQWTSLEYQGRHPRFAWPPYYYVFKGDTFGAYDGTHVERLKGKIKLDAANRAIDLVVTEGAEKGTVLLSGLYAWHGQGRLSDRPTLLLLGFDPQTRTRPRELKTNPTSTVQVWTCQRRNLEGTWTVVTHDLLGKPAGKDFLARRHQWDFKDGKLTMTSQGGAAREGTYDADDANNPRALTVLVKAGLPPGPGAAAGNGERTEAICALDGNTLTVCYAYPRGGRPTGFVSTADPPTGLVVLRRDYLHKNAPPPEDLAGVWRLDGNGFPGNLLLDVGKGGEIAGTMYSQRITGEYTADAGRIVLRRYGNTQSTISKVVQVYTGDVLPVDAPGAFPYSLKGTFLATGDPRWGQEGVEYPWKAVRYKDYVTTISIPDIMREAHLTPGNRGTKNNLDNKVMDGKATRVEQQQLLDLYQALGRREPPRGDGRAWKARTGEMVAAVKAVMAGENQAAVRLLKARDCKACHAAHRPAN
jgi:RNA polymerase sigma factor (sigma-70 family)